MDPLLSLFFIPVSVKKRCPSDLRELPRKSRPRDLPFDAPKGTSQVRVVRTTTSIRFSSALVAVHGCDRQHEDGKRDEREQKVLHFPTVPSPTLKRSLRCSQGPAKAAQNRTFNR